LWAQDAVAKRIESMDDLALGMSRETVLAGLASANYKLRKTLIDSRVLTARFLVAIREPLRPRPSDRVHILRLT
jgi:hypothetical protein